MFVRRPYNDKRNLADTEQPGPTYLKQKNDLLDVLGCREFTSLHVNDLLILRQYGSHLVGNASLTC